MNSPVRGLRNNNPFNIKKSRQPWLGKCLGVDKVFESFSLLEYGVRAGLKLLTTYVHRGIDSPNKIIHRFAPTSENNTQNYLDFVCRTLVGDKRLDVDKPINELDDLLFLAHRIIKYECHLSEGQLFAYGFDPVSLKQIFLKYKLKF